MPYLFDGNNLLGSWGGPRLHDDRRPEVVRRVAEFCRLKGGGRGQLLAVVRQDAVSDVQSSLGRCRVCNYFFNHQRRHLLGGGACHHQDRDFE